MKTTPNGDETEMTAKLLPISSARSAGERLGHRSVIVLQELPGGQWGYTSWGRTKADCGRARRIADECMMMAEVFAEIEDRKA